MFTIQLLFYKETLSLTKIKMKLNKLQLMVFN